MSPIKITMLLGLLMNLVFGSAANAVIRLLPLEEYVSESTYIVIGNVESILPDVVEVTLDWGTTTRYKIAVLKIEDEISGEIEGNEVRILFEIDSSTAPDYRIGERYLLFIKERGGRNYSYMNHGGSLKISNGLLEEVYMKDQDGKQELTIFVNKIRKIVERGLGPQHRDGN